MSESSPFFYQLESKKYSTDEIGDANVSINGITGISAIFPLKNHVGRNYVPESKAFNVNSPFLIPQIKFSLSEDASTIYVIGEVNKQMQTYEDDSLFRHNKAHAYMNLYSLACGMYELHQMGLPFGHVSYKNFVIDQNRMFCLFGYGFNNRDGNHKESIEKDYTNFSKLVSLYFPEYENQTVKIEQIITTEIILDDLYFHQLERQRKIARERYKKLHFKNVDLIEINIKDIYPFLPPQYERYSKTQADLMIKTMQAQYGGTPEEAYKAFEKESERNAQITQELLNRPPGNPNPDKPYDLSYRKIMIRTHPFSNKGDFFDCMASDFEGKSLTPLHHILFKNAPPDYIPNENIFNIDFEPLNNFLGYYKYYGDFCLISQYSYFQNLSIIAPFEARIRNEPVIASIFIIGIASAVYYLHLKNLCADGINMKKILIDANTFHPVLIEYGNPQLIRKTMDDDEKELLDLCKDFFPNTFKKIDIPVSEKILKGDIKIMESKDVNDYRTKMLNKIDELESINYDLNKFSHEKHTKEDEGKPHIEIEPQNNDDNMEENNVNASSNTGYDEDESTENEKNNENSNLNTINDDEENNKIIKPKEENKTNDLIDDEEDKIKDSSSMQEDKINDETGICPPKGKSKEETDLNETNNDEYYKYLDDLEIIPMKIPNKIIEKNACKKYGLSYELRKNVFSENDPFFLYQQMDKITEALMNIRHSKKTALNMIDAPYSSRQCQGTLLKTKFTLIMPDHLLELIQFSGANGIREIDEHYSQYNAYSSDIPISVAFQLLLDFSPHMSPPESTYTFSTHELIEYAKKGDCGALYRIGKLMNNIDLIRKASDWNYPPALYDIGRIDNNDTLISKSAEKDYPLAKAFIKYGKFTGTDEELVMKYITDYPNSEITADFYLYGIHVERDEKKALSILIENKKYFKLGMYYLFYKEIRFSEAYEAFTKGYENDHDPRCRFAQIILDIYINEIYYDDLKEEMMKLANDGLVQAKFFIGQREIAAKQGLRTAMFEYGRDFYLGENGKKMCVAKGYPYIMAAHRLGHPYAYQLLVISGRDPPIINIDDDLEKFDNDKLFHFSKLLYEGRYTDRDYEKSYRCIEIAANREYEKALYMKAYYLQYGIGVIKNTSDALNIYEHINSDDSLCQQAIINIVNNKELKSGYSKLSTAINNGCAKAAFLLGILKNDTKGIELHKLASQHGIVDADFFLKCTHQSSNENLFKYIFNLAQSGYDIAIIALNSIVWDNIYQDDYCDADFIEKRTFLKKYLNINTIFQGLGNNFPGFYDKDIFSYPNNIKALPLTQMNILSNNEPKEYSQLYNIMSEFDNPACLTYKANQMIQSYKSILPLQKALICYKKASKLGNMSATLQLAHCYYIGFIVHQDKNKAIFYAQKAAQTGIPFASNYLQYIIDPEVNIPRNYRLNNFLAKTLIESKNKHLNINHQKDEKSESDISLSTTTTSETNENHLSLNDEDELDNIETNILDQNQLIRNSLILKAQDINNTDAIFEYGSALFYGDYGFDKNRDAAKEQFMRIRSNGSAGFMLQTRYDAPIKPIYRKKMTKKEEQFLTSDSLGPNTNSEIEKSDGCCTCCNCCICKNKSDDEDEDEGIISNALDFGNIIKSVWPIISVAISIIKIFQGASLSTNNKSITFNSTINKIVDWSIKLIRDIIDWTQVENISSTQTGMLMTFLVLFGFTFPLCSLKRSAQFFILCLISSLIFAPLGIGIAMKKWIIFGVFLGYYVIIWPLIWWISKLIKDKKIWNICMIIFYIPQTIVGFAYVCFYILIFKPNHGIVQALMPYLRFLPIEKIEDFFSTDYQYFNLLYGIESDSTLNACISWGISWILFDTLLYWILGLCPVFYFVLALTIIIYIISLIVIIRGIYFVKYTMQFLSFFAIFVYEKLLELLLMPAVDLVCGDEESSLSHITQATIIILAIILPFAFITLISLATYHQSRTYHPAVFYGFLATTISVDGICDGFKMKFCFWPIVDNLYQIIFSVLTVYTTPIVPCIFAFIYFIIIWCFRPNLLVTDNIIISGEPFALFIFNLIVFINKSKTVPLWAGILLIILAILPAIICIIYYYAKQRGHEFEMLTRDMQYEVDVRRKNSTKPLDFIDVKNTWKIMRPCANREKSLFLFMKHFTLVEPVSIEEDDFPAPKFIQKIIDIRSSFFIDVLCSCSLTIGTFLFYMQIGEYFNST